MVADYWTDGNWSLPENLMLARPNILSILSNFAISNMDKEDLLAWKSVENGMLSIKHAYKLLMNNKTDKIFSWPWDTDVAPAHSMVCWRLLHNKLPTDDNLKIRGFSFPFVCSLCCGHMESSTHLFFECQFAKSIWNWLSSQFSCPMPIVYLQDCFLVLDKPWSSQARAVAKACIMHTLYLIWQARNQLRFDNKHTHWKSCVSKIMANAKMVGNLTKKKANDYMLSFTFLKSFDVKLNPRDTIAMIDVIWSPPLQGWIKCNIDGKVDGSLAAGGGIFRDWQASHILSFSAFFGEGSRVVEEFMATIMAIEKAMMMKWKKLWIETDCKLVVLAISNSNLVPWSLKSRWLTCWEYTLSIDFRISHIYREANFCADFLENIGFRSKSISWFSYVHKEITKDYLLDKIGTPRLRLIC
ncbi:uncharacterized protein LOC131604270 [Vicia villosa]|uniref:uncharacterized protein LOC131604270 n=1 Tax=Vicia villosa TaxID=3911 RepID=UPI00273AF014|nr:uncharacterized protein LOC131604270 [Vicia villosa]